MDGGMSYFFISYAPDDASVAHMVKTELEKVTVPVWMDPGRLSDDHPWHTGIDQAIKHALAVIVIVTSTASSNEYVMYEWVFALGAEIRVIPLIFTSTAMHPRMHTLDPLDFTQPDAYPWDTLIATTRQILETRSDSASPPVASAHPTPQDTQKPPDRTPDIESALPLPGNHAAVREALIESLNHPMPDVRIQASLMLSQFKDLQAVPVLIDALSNEDREVHQHASWSLLHIGMPAVPQLINALYENTTPARKDIVHILGQIGDTQAVSALVDVLTDDADDVRKAAAESLGNLGHSDAVPALRTLLHDHQEPVRLAATEALGQIGHPAAVPELIAALHDKSEDVRVIAVWALGQTKDTTATPALINALRTEGVRVRQAAAETLKEVGDSSAEAGLNEALLDEDMDVRRTAARVLGHIRSKHRRG